MMSTVKGGYLHRPEAEPDAQVDDRHDDTPQIDHPLMKSGAPPIGVTAP